MQVIFLPADKLQMLTFNFLKQKRMKKTIVALLGISLAIISCSNNKSTGKTTTPATVDASQPWNFGIGLYTFHTLDFQDALSKIDSAGLKYLEPIGFQKAGPGFKDSVISQLSPDGISKLKALIDQKGFIAQSMYIGGDATIASWKQQFEIAKQLGLKFVTTEPPLNMWDSIDSLAGVYGIKVAIHEHWKGTSPYWNPDTVLAAIKGHPNFGACADLGHWPKSGIEPLEAVKKLSGHILGVHFKDIAAFNDPKLKDVVPGTGVVNFPAILKELKAQHFTGNIYIERDSTEPAGNLPSVIQTVKYYNEQMGKLAQ